MNNKEYFDQYGRMLDPESGYCDWSVHVRWRFIATVNEGVSSESGIPPGYYQAVERLHLSLPGYQFLDAEQVCSAGFRSSDGACAISYFNLCLPRISEDLTNPKIYRQLVLEEFLPALEKMYCQTYPGRKFENILSRKLDNLQFVDPRYIKLLETIQDGPIKGILVFPFTHFSANRQVELIQQLPNRCCGLGFLAAIIAYIMHKDLSHGQFCPGVMTSAVQFGNELNRYTPTLSVLDDRMLVSSNNAGSVFNGASGGLLFW